MSSLQTCSWPPRHPIIVVSREPAGAYRRPTCSSSSSTSTQRPWPEAVPIAMSSPTRSEMQEPRRNNDMQLGPIDTERAARNQCKASRTASESATRWIVLRSSRDALDEASRGSAARRGGLRSCRCHNGVEARLQVRCPCSSHAMIAPAAGLLQRRRARILRPRPSSADPARPTGVAARATPAANAVSG